MASLDSVKMKLYRARHHSLELDEELKSYYKSDPVKFSIEAGGFQIGAVEPVPARFGLIAGDVLQNMRSSLDYLVWELVLANGKQPNSQNAFPVSLDIGRYKNEIDNRKRLDGVAPEAVALIDALQPLNLDPAARATSPLALLDSLTNINKHRRVLLTTLKRQVYGEEPLPFPHLLSDLTATAPGMPKGTLVTFGFYVAFDEGSISGTEIGTALNVFADFIWHEVLPLFENFFKLP